MAFSIKYLILKSAVLLLRGIIYLIGIPPAQPDLIKEIPSRDPKRTIRSHIYHPSHKTTGPVPVLINFCGSGFVARGHGVDDEYCRFVSNHSPHTVIDVEYRLAPENPFPAPLEDAEDVVKWVRSHPELFDLSRVAISGFSAGANIALSAAVNSEPGTFHTAIAFYPPVDNSVDPTLKIAPDPTGSPLPSWYMRLCYRCYTVGTGVDARDPRVSPAFASLTSFPRKLLLVTAAQDTMATEVDVLADKLKAAEDGRKVVAVRMEACGHAWDKFAKEGSPQWDAKIRAYEMAVQLLEEK